MNTTRLSENIFLDFENLIVKILKSLGFVVDQKGFGRDRTIDLAFIIENEINVLSDVKFFRSRNVSSSTILAASTKLAYVIAPEKNTRGLLIVSSYVPQKLREEILENIGILVFDRSIIYNIIINGNLNSLFLEEFKHLLITVKQGIDTEEVFKDIEKESLPPYEYFHFLTKIQPKKDIIQEPQKKGKDLCQELRDIEPGINGWPEFENKCIEILKYLFDESLSLWSKQQRTDDELSRFDLICRIVSTNDFWKALVQSFGSRYIMFEFKNYTDKITQDQIYSTERYLFTKALRSVCFLITREGGKDQALTAAKGALREHGKLILIFGIEDFCKMLNSKDKGDLPEDYLSQKLDDFLVSLSR